MWELSLLPYLLTHFCPFFPNLPNNVYIYFGQYIWFSYSYVRMHYIEKQESVYKLIKENVYKVYGMLSDLAKIIQLINLYLNLSLCDWSFSLPLSHVCYTTLKKGAAQ